MTIEELARQLALTAAREQLSPKGFWPEAGEFIEFAGFAMTREDLTALFFSRHRNHLMAEAAFILSHPEKSQ